MSIKNSISIKLSLIKTLIDTTYYKYLWFVLSLNIIFQISNVLVGASYCIV